LQFFPEGGSLVEGVMSRVGFKACNVNGRGCIVSGKLVNSSGDSVASFESNSLGMGSFLLIPQPNTKYKAVLLSPKTSMEEINFPSVMQMGYALTMKNYDDSTLIISVNTNENTLKKYHKQKLTLTSEFRGKQLLTASIKLKSTYGHFLLAKNEFPNGIVRFTIHDEQNRPWCERLFYIDRKENIVVSIDSVKEIYSPHEKVTLTISVRDSANKPVQANLSLSATDAYLSGNKNDIENDIYSYFMLESDIHGSVEQPSHYFDTLNTNRYNDLDVLLLTQGWRDFVWKHFTDTIIPIKYANETGISISGELYTLLTHKPKANTDVSLCLKKDDQTFFDHIQTDSLGVYKFENLDFTDSCNITVSAFNDKHTAAGEITINSIFGEPMEESNYKLLATNTLNENTPTEDTEDYKKYFYSHENGLPTIAIEEVKVIENKVIKNDYLNPYYYEPDWTHEVVVTDYSYQNVFEYLEGRVAGVNIGKGSKGYKVTMRGITSINGGSVLLLLDGVETDAGMLESVPMSIVDKIDVSKQGVGYKAGNGVLSVYTKKGKNAPPRKIFNSINKTLIGFYQAREFYAPKYETPDSLNKKPDIRPTIFWEPTLITDENGNATVSYYNDDRRKYINIKIEGMANKSVPVVFKASYRVE